MNFRPSQHNVTNVSPQIVDSFSARDAAEFSGVSLAMVNYLCRHRIVVPAIGPKRGRGVQRRFSFGDIVVLKAIAKLLDGGVSVYRLKRALTSLRSLHGDITTEGLPAAYLVTNGRDVYFRHKSGVFELLATGQFGFAFIVEIDSVRREAVTFAKARTAAISDRRRSPPASPRRARGG
jgi:DNA-binding transcriptional MerR regulator